jgi:hypothetical protein
MVGDGVSPGSYIEFTNPDGDRIYGPNGNRARVTYAPPPGGDFVPAGVAGRSYISPGYV